MAENRGSPRIRTDALVDVAGTDALLFHRIRDLGTGGISIESTALEAEGTEVDLCINFPDLGETVETRGVVVRVDGPTGVMGIRFLDLTPEQLGVLERYLALRTGLGGEGR